MTALRLCALALMLVACAPTPAPTQTPPTVVVPPAPTAGPVSGTPLPTVPVAVQPTPTPLALPPARTPTLVPTQVFAPSPVPTAGPPPATPTAVPPATPTPAPKPSLERTNWESFVLQDPAIRDLFTPTKGARGVELEGRNPDVWGGTADVRNVILGDADEDGIKEALIPIHSGGTAGTIGFLLYAPAAPAPRLVDLLPGYKMWAGFEKGAVVITMPVYGGWEPNCCPSGLSVEKLKLSAGRLSRINLSETGEAAAKPIVADLFYNALRERRYREAYAFLSDGYQAANPFTAWERGYSRTVDIDIISTRLQPDGTVRARLVATDRDANNQRSERRYEIVWSMIFVPPPEKAGARKIHGWLLDKPLVAVDEPLKPADDKRTGTITGRLQYPSDFVPALVITAQNIRSGARYTTNTRQNQTSYAIAVPAGDYHVFAHLREGDDSLAGGYSEYVTCGLKAECPSHALIEVEVRVNGTAFNVDISDWYAPPGAFPRKTRR